MSEEYTQFQSTDKDQEYLEKLNCLSEDQAKLEYKLSELAEQSKTGFEKLDQQISDTALEIQEQVLLSRDSQKAKKDSFKDYSLMISVSFALIAVACGVYTLQATAKLNSQWQKEVDEKMQTAIQLERAINYFQQIKGKENAGQSDKPTSGQ